jgi:NAD(P)H-dependent FMN reductase
LAPPDAVVPLYEGLGGLPRFDPDDDADPLPPEVTDLGAAMHAASALVFLTPEYAGALPGSSRTRSLSGTHNAR